MSLEHFGHEGDAALNAYVGKSHQARMAIFWCTPALRSPRRSWSGLCPRPRRVRV